MGGGGTGVLRPRPRVRPPVRRRGEHVLPVQRTERLLQPAHHVRVTVAALSGSSGLEYTAFFHAGGTSLPSIADASRCRTTDVNSAVCSGSGACSRSGFDPGPTRTIVISRCGGTLSSFIRPGRNTEISSTRSRAFAMLAPVVRVGGRSSSGHVGSSTNRPYAAACSSVRNFTDARRAVAASRRRPTTFPGNPTRSPAPVLNDQDQSQRRPRFH